jgi:hypothetical protein
MKCGSSAETEQTKSIVMDGISKEQVLDLLKQFDWNWYLVADHLDVDADILRERYATEAESNSLPAGPTPFSAAHIRTRDVAQLQRFVREHLVDPLPVLFKDELPPDQREQIASAILLEMGLPYRLTHSPEFIDTYATLEDEAIALARWREQVAYLSVLEEALFRVSVKLEREKKQAEELERDE